MGTYTLKSQVKAKDKPTGSEKLATFKSGSSNSSSQTPSEYRESTSSKTAEEISAGQLITSTGERIQGIDRTQQVLSAINAAKQQTSATKYVTPTIPTPVKDVAAWQAFQAEQSQKTIQPAKYDPVSMWRGYQPESETLVAKTKAYIAKQTEKGYEEAKDIEVSETSQNLYEQSQKLANQIRQYSGSTFEKITTPGLSRLGGSPSESIARIVETGGMIPTGVETLSKNKDLIVPSIVVGTSMTVGGIGTSIKEEPGQFLSDIATQAFIGYGIGKGTGSIKSSIKYFGKESVPIETLARPEVVSESVTFPTAKKGTPIESIIQTFKETKYRYPESLETGREYGIHVSGSELPKQLTTLPGTSETPGLYVGPDASLYFTGIKDTSPTKIKLFGLDQPKAEPSISFVGMRGIERLSPELRTDIRAANIFMEQTAPKEVGFTSVKMEMGLKYGSRERELIIPPESQFKAVETKYFTEYKGKKISIRKYEPIGEEIPRIETSIIGKSRKVKASDISSSSAKTKEYSIITPSKIAKSYGYGLVESRVSQSYMGVPYSSPMSISGSVAPSIQRISSNKYAKSIAGIDSSIKSSKSEYVPSESYTSQLITSDYIESYKQPSYKTSNLPKIPQIIEVKPKKQVKRKSKKITSKKQQQFFELVNPLKTVRDVYGF